MPDTPTIYLIAGARPNFMKIAPLVRAMQAPSCRVRFRIVHTGQHYDAAMSQVFFDELGIPAPDFHLGVGSGTHAQQTARIMTEFEAVCVAEKPDHVLVVGDVNSTAACSIAAKKLHISVSHVEAGLRSFDRTMPEEINRLITDSISDWFFCTEQSAVDNLRNEGAAAEAVFHVGHVMVDNVLYQTAKLDRGPAVNFASTPLKERLGAYGIVTLHRASNVDDAAVLAGIARALRELSQTLPLIFPVHPRTRKTLESFGLDLGSGVFLTEPLGYMEFLNLWRGAKMVLTDSGGLQEETTALGVPCLTLRDNTERPVTVEEGTNTVVGTEPARILAAAQEILADRTKAGRRPALWDGHAAVRIVQELERLLA